MNITTKIVAVTVSSFVISSTIYAATVTADFKGTVFFAEGFGDSVSDEMVELTIGGRDDADSVLVPPLPEFAKPPLPDAISGLTFSAFDVYDLNQFSFALPDLDIGFDATEAYIYVGTDVADPTGENAGLFDIVAAYGFVEGDEGAALAEIAYLSSFATGTLPGTSLDTAVALGLSNESALFEAAYLSIAPPVRPSAGCVAGEDDSCLLVAAVSLDDIEVVQDDIPDDTPIDGEMPETTPIPLPAAGWALLAALGGMAGLRRRKS
ncbi:MAG: VPLPA-CTERM sorting domain-containing protein [Pseudomonadota bacterium]